MSRAQQFIDAAKQVAGGADVREVVGQTVQNVAQQAGMSGDGFGLSAKDFPAARENGSSAGTRIQAESCSLDDASEKLSRSHYEMGPNGPLHVITPMVMPRGRKLRALLPVILLAIVGIVGYVILLPTENLGGALFGVHYWIIVLLIAAFMWWRQGMVMVPEGCTALISRFGKVEAEVGPGRVTLWNPWKRVSYIVNTTREYPFNAPIRQAPTKSGVQASVDLFLQFRIVSAREFVFVLGAVNGFQDKLNNAISETTRSLIYEQEASGIYDLVGESTTRLLEQLNSQFAPAVELTTANITHAEPSAQEYRMDLAAPEMVRVAKEAYTYEYELNLRKEQNEGDLNKDLASLNESLSAIQADVARYQAQMDTALERETNRADAMARQRFVEAESTAQANAALLEAQALDIRAMSAALAPEILDYRYQRDVLDKLESLADSLPQIVRVGGDSEGVDFLGIARGLVGGSEDKLFTSEDMEGIRTRKNEIAERIEGRSDEIEHLLEPPEETTVEIVSEGEEAAVPGEDRMEEIRRSVTAPEDGSAPEAAAPQAAAPQETAHQERAPEERAPQTREEVTREPAPGQGAGGQQHQGRPQGHGGPQAPAGHPGQQPPPGMPPVGGPPQGGPNGPNGPQQGGRGQGFAPVGPQQGDPRLGGPGQAAPGQGAPDQGQPPSAGQSRAQQFIERSRQQMRGVTNPEEGNNE
ncbi:SPFH domain-containing protein [Ornithinicoccus hortensis]|uniref:Regulator of protease activity HflC (Stomatin/prohibitin superfamily) n=1 Tax=Ornithinicoccus hortensis TaxID=82346 RepID=A0A542YNS4_9MICO|nr:SPFH domain-containing protein [Ornithinicoccus hortensis]TQL49748.1 regulator of protease activity HflC (stomatin/prohibitin superfamily) [Ornithinicoccus hortensis]